MPHVMSRSGAAIVGDASRTAEEVQSCRNKYSCAVQAQDVAGRPFLSFIFSENGQSAMMFALRGCGGFSRALRAGRAQRVLPMVSPNTSILLPRRTFHAAPALWSVKSQVLKDVGEGESMLRPPILQLQSAYLILPSTRDNGGSDHPMVRRRRGTY